MFSHDITVPRGLRAWEIVVDGGVIGAGQMPAAIGADRFAVFRISIAPDGEPSLAGPTIVDEPPEDAAQQLTCS